MARLLFRVCCLRDGHLLALYQHSRIRARARHRGIYTDVGAVRIDGGLFCAVGLLCKMAQRAVSHPALVSDLASSIDAV